MAYDLLGSAHRQRPHLRSKYGKHVGAVPDQVHSGHRSFQRFGGASAIRSRSPQSAPCAGGGTPQYICGPSWRPSSSETAVCGHRRISALSPRSQIARLLSWSTGLMPRCLSQTKRQSFSWRCISRLHTCGGARSNQTFQPTPPARLNFDVGSIRCHLS